MHKTSSCICPKTSIACLNTTEISNYKGKAQISAEAELLPGKNSPSRRPSSFYEHWIKSAQVSELIQHKATLKFQMQSATKGENYIAFLEPLFLLFSKYILLLISTLMMSHFCHPLLFVLVLESPCSPFIYEKVKRRSSWPLIVDYCLCPERLCFGFDFALLIIISY